MKGVKSAVSTTIQSAMEGVDRDRDSVVVNVVLFAKGVWGILNVKEIDGT